MSRESYKAIERAKKIGAMSMEQQRAYLESEKRHEPEKGSADCAPRTCSAASWRTLAMRLADESTAVLDNAHWEVKHGSGDLLTTIKAVREKYRLETQMPPNC